MHSRAGDNVRKQPSNSAEQFKRVSSLLQVQKAHGAPSPPPRRTIAAAAAVKCCSAPKKNTEVKIEKNTANMKMHFRRIWRCSTSECVCLFAAPPAGLLQHLGFSVCVRRLYLRSRFYSASTQPWCFYRPRACISLAVPSVYTPIIVRNNTTQ